MSIRITSKAPYETSGILFTENQICSSNDDYRAVNKLFERLKKPLLNFQEFREKFADAELQFIVDYRKYYNIELTLDDYEEILNNCKFQGLFEIKEREESIGVIKYKEEYIFVSYSRSLKLFLKVYHNSISTDVFRTISVCFSKELKSLAILILSEIVNDFENAKFDFKNNRDAKEYYSANHKFPLLLMDKFKHNYVRPFRICSSIRNVIHGKSKYVNLTTVKI